MTTLNVGIIGLGMGFGHGKIYRTHPSVRLQCVADPDADRLRERGGELGVENLYTDALEMLQKEDLDLVSIATPNKFHHPYALAAFDEGCHVLCEKPMAMNAAQAREMLEASKKAGKRLMINFAYRFRDVSWAMKKQVESGLLGEIYYARTLWNRRRGLPRFGGWFGQKELSGGGPLIDLGVHRLDLALWLMGYPKPAWILASAYDPIATDLAKRENKVYDVEDMAAAHIRFENGASLSLEASWASNIRDAEEMETRLLGTKAGLIQRNVGGGYDFETAIHIERDGCQFDMQLRPPMPGATTPYLHMVDCILEDRPHTATGEEGLLVMELLDAIYESARLGEPVRVGED
jgi:predicted dehydrogenase